MISKTKQINKKIQNVFQILFKILIHFSCASHLSLNITIWRVNIIMKHINVIKSHKYIIDKSPTIELELFSQRTKIATHAKNINQVRI